MNADCVILDANIAFKCLRAGGGDIRSRFVPNSPIKVCAPRFLVVELFKHKDRLLRATQVTEESLLEALYTLLSRLDLVNEANIPLGTWMEAYRLCKGIDEKDTPYVALTLHMNGRLWTEDDELKTGLKARGFDRFLDP